MEKPRDLTSVSRFTTYASHAARRKFDDGRYWEIILSAALIHEVEHENICLSKYFTFGINHEAKIIRRSGQYVQLEVSVFRHNEQFPMPKVAVNTTIKLRTGDLIGERDCEVADKDGDGDDEIAGDNQIYQGREYRAKVLGKETNGAFVISIFFDKRDKDAEAKFSLNSRVNIQLELKRNHLLSDRQLAAISSISRADKDESFIRLFMGTKGYKRFPSVVTIDSMQGGQNENIILDL
jgi:hypothetical protein